MTNTAARVAFCALLFPLVAWAEPAPQPGPFELYFQLWDNDFTLALVYRF